MSENDINADQWALIYAFCATPWVVSSTFAISLRKVISRCRDIATEQA
ncbi:MULTISPECIES: hypothetical protein [Glutamicibacter]|nr:MULTISPECIES: hypothetical protein [Glutamicibacter]MBF6673234.1 hypothetical protein [Glutamicibacter sp. FBE19]